MNLGRLLRIAAAIAILVGGLVHLDLYFGGYRQASADANFGRSILLNAIASGVIAAAVAARREWFVRLAGIALAASTLAVFAYTHSSHDFLGFQASGWDPSPQAQIAVIAEIAAVLMLLATFIPAVASTDVSFPAPLFAASAAVAAVVLIGFGAYWADDYGTSARTVASGDTTAPAGATTVPGATSVPGDTIAAGGSTTTATGGAPGGDATPAAGAATVTIADFAFIEPQITLPVGSSLTWTNSDSFGHSVVADDDSFRSETLESGATFVHTFDTAGDFTYICGIHPSMTGTVTVTG
jgi:plastocyanin